MSEDNLNADELSSKVLPKRPGNKTRNPVFSFLLEVVIVVFFAVIVSTLLRQFVFQVYLIPSGSMENTLQVNDRILVNRLPIIGKQVERGDVIVFSDSQGWLSAAEEPANSILRSMGEFVGLLPNNGEQVLVKRVIGLGGDEVSCCTPDGQLEVNGVPIDEPYLKDPLPASSQEFSVTVPEDSYWVMGDNRNNSGDSRKHLATNTAFIPKEDVIGKVQWVIWPLNAWHSVAEREAFAYVPDAS